MGKYKSDNSSFNENIKNPTNGDIFEENWLVFGTYMDKLEKFYWAYLLNLIVIFKGVVTICVGCWFQIPYFSLLILFGIVLIPIYIYLMKVVIIVKEINNSLNNLPLRYFCSNLKSAIIANSIGLLGFLFSLIYDFLEIVKFEGILKLTVQWATIFLLIGRVLGSMFEIFAWKQMEDYFKTYIDQNPTKIQLEAAISSGKLKFSSIFSLKKIFEQIFHFMRIFNMSNILHQKQEIIKF